MWSPQGSVPRSLPCINACERDEHISCCCWPIPSCAAQHGIWTTGDMHICMCMPACVHSHAHAITCIHASRPNVVLWEILVCSASGKAECAKHLGVWSMQFHITWLGACLHYPPGGVTVPMGGQPASHGVIGLARAASCLHMCFMRINSVVF